MYIKTQLYVVVVVVVVVESDQLFRNLYCERELQWKIVNINKRRKLCVLLSGELRYRL